MPKKNSDEPGKQIEFSGNVFIFQAFDIGDSIGLEKVKLSKKLLLPKQATPKYFKNYHTPLTTELPHPHTSSKCMFAKLHHFGAASLVYKIPFTQTLASLKQDINEIDDKYQEESVTNAKNLFKNIKKFIYQPNFFHHRTSYIVIQVDPHPDITDIKQLKTEYGNTIASMLRFEKQQLSEYQSKDVLEDDIGYFRKDFVVIDAECSFVYDSDYEELLDFFEFANLQQLELQYFDKVLDKQLNAFYEKKVPQIPLTAYLPFIGAKVNNHISELDRLRVDISVITERLENSIKLVGEAYYSELYRQLKEKLNIDNWKESIEKKLAIIRDIKTVYNDKINVIREDILEGLIIVLIFIEIVIGIVK